MKIETINKIIGLDLSLTSTGIAVYSMRGITTRHEEGYLIHDAQFDIMCTKTIKTTNKLSMFDRYNEIISGVYKLSDPDEECFYIIEGYSFGSFGKSSSMSYLIELGGILRYRLKQDNRDFIIVPPTVLKKFTTGSGNSKKEDMKLWLYKKYKTEFKTSDEADAFALMVFGLKYLEIPNKFSLRVTGSEEACLKQVKGIGEW